MTLGAHQSVDGVRFFFRKVVEGFRSEMRITQAGIASVVMVNNASFNPGHF
jgi:hypothetical protein